ncbi:hypothetical protein LTR37_018923 [Vermiconidia calcicola]|uniref:Uncharacterized protein n=1 Tax=Vermiconidia calcicola TaxID=1690605 RepID=A0ACC3MHE4_9PEZI|nr:hypothetical protein LTR37_018923 [Vermiconidia calcicola]
MSTSLEQQVNSDILFHLHRLHVDDGVEMAYVDTDPQQTHEKTVVFLHGNPTSSYLWRNIIPHVQPHARCIAPDLIGMGASSKPPYFDGRFHSHARYLETFLSHVNNNRAGGIDLVLHDWGSALGLDWARRHEEEVAGLVLMEFIHPWPTWEDFAASGPARELFQLFRTPGGEGRKLLIEENAFIESVLPGGVIRPLTEAEMQHYRAPFLHPKHREPLYRFPNELPIAGQPEDVDAAVEAYHEWLLNSELRKLFFWASPGALIRQEDAAFYETKLKRCRSVFVGEGSHYLQEDHPDLIGREIGSWLTLNVGIST